MLLSTQIFRRNFWWGRPSPHCYFVRSYPFKRGHPATPRVSPARKPLAERRTIAATGDRHSPKTCQAVVKTAPPLALSRPDDRLIPWMMLRTSELAPRRSNTSLLLRFDFVHGSPQGGTPRTIALSQKPAQNRISSTAFPRRPLLGSLSRSMNARLYDALLSSRPLGSPHAYGDRQGAFGASKGCP